MLHLHPGNRLVCQIMVEDVIGILEIGPGLNWPGVGLVLWDGRLPLFCQHRLLEEGTMSLGLLAIDLGKRSFHIHGIDSDGVIVSCRGVVPN
jgi:hypothetical protein